MNIYCKNCGRPIHYYDDYKEWEHKNWTPAIECKNAEPDDKHWNR